MCAIFKDLLSTIPFTGNVVGARYSRNGAVKGYNNILFLNLRYVDSTPVRMAITPDGMHEAESRYEKYVSALGEERDAPIGCIVPTRAILTSKMNNDKHRVEMLACCRVRHGGQIHILAFTQSQFKACTEKFYKIRLRMTFFMNWFKRLIYDIAVLIGKEKPI